ncbi:ABC transporter ATP-binding protein [Sneathiella sp. CAU 1612]|uniref:ABC transporter ATP-binding protein n=1 Tax=Sneathiella sedimenti TaxID=2816034 RepID=A0ABS3F291_9PROT|nr:ABC transporter ATP-binding protein [Sneathiella sedimenti]MBO0332624.1 ABC transporter ATP-binding protein [Sneathiella sedimenti]
MSDKVLEIRNLNVTFPSLERNVHAIRNCTLHVNRGEILGLVGESGSGKSVTSMAALGLLGSSARVKGNIRVVGREIIDRSEAELQEIRGRKVAMIFQNPFTALNPFFQVGRQVMDALLNSHFMSKEEARKRVFQAFKDVRLPDPEIAFNRYPHQMSGGQLQRVMIAMALVCEPELLIADEPTTALDVTVQAQIILLLRELVAKKNLSILFITHDLGVVAALCDRVAVMYAGMVVESGPVVDVLATPSHPYTSALMKTVPALGQTKDDLSYIPGQVPDMSVPIIGCAFAERCTKVSEVCHKQAPPRRAVLTDQFSFCHNASGPVALDEIVAGGRL